MMLLLSQLAFAKVAAAGMEACSDAYVVATVPAAGATVPYDLSPAIVWADDCGLGGVFEVRIEQAEDLVGSHTVVVDAGTRSGLDRIPLESPLLPNTEYRLVIESDWEQVEVLFSTHEGQVQGAQAPSLSHYSAEVWEDAELSVSGTVDATLGDDPDELSVLLLRSEEGDLIAASAESSSIWFDQTVDVVPEEFCVSLTQQDGAGVESEPVVACAVPEVIDSGCSTSPLGASMLIALAGLLMVRRRS